MNVGRVEVWGKEEAESETSVISTNSMEIDAWEHDGNASGSSSSQVGREKTNLAGPSRGP